MKAISVADLRNNFAEISALLLAGEKLVVTKRGRPFATLSPAIKRKDSKLAWPDRREWRSKIFSKKSTDKAKVGVIDYDRGET